MDNCNKELQAVYDKIAELSITAPHAGNLREVADFKVVTPSTRATPSPPWSTTPSCASPCTTATPMRVTSRWASAPDDSRHHGARHRQGGEINKVRFVSPPRSHSFEVVLVLDNPGTLAEGWMPLPPHRRRRNIPPTRTRTESWSADTTKITAKATGPVERVSLLNYGDVKAGQLLVQLGAKDTDRGIASKENALKAAQEKLEEATKELEKYNAVAPIDGTVLQCSLTEGQEVSSGQGITIADTSMIIEISVDERNARYIKAGMMVDINQYDTPYVGIVESVSMTASGENGVASIPAVVTVDNYDGSMIRVLMPNTPSWPASRRTASPSPSRPSSMSASPTSSSPKPWMPIPPPEWMTV
ncbi:MAG: HlyD family efflux transporter periplasmic adaptor subunit [Flavonifractor plautii]